MKEESPTFRIYLFALSILSASITGCQTSTPTRLGAPDISAAPLPVDRPPTPDEAVGSDESAVRLHDIVGAILAYYIQNQYRLPDFLEQIKPYGDFGTQINLTSPSSGLPYSYSPGGLFAAGQEKRVIVWDPKPDKHGIRWCILMPHMEPGKAIVPEVVPISEKAFAAFVPPLP